MLKHVYEKKIKNCFHFHVNSRKSNVRIQKDLPCVLHVHHIKGVNQVEKRAGGADGNTLACVTIS
jgi:hypothetical protein